MSYADMVVEKCRKIAAYLRGDNLSHDPAIDDYVASNILYNLLNDKDEWKRLDILLNKSLIYDARSSSPADLRMILITLQEMMHDAIEYAASQEVDEELGTEE